MKTNEPVGKEALVNVRVPEKIKREIERRAKRQGTTVSDVVRQLLAEATGKDVPTKAWSPRRAG